MVPAFQKATAQFPTLQNFADLARIITRPRSLNFSSRSGCPQVGMVGSLVSTFIAITHDGLFVGRFAHASIVFFG